MKTFMILLAISLNLFGASFVSAQYGCSPYVVQPGDNCWKICQTCAAGRYNPGIIYGPGSCVYLLQQANPARGINNDCNNLYAGNLIFAAAAPTTAVYQPSGYQAYASNYVVSNGETCDFICQNEAVRTGVNFFQCKADLFANNPAVNNPSCNNLKVGQSLFIASRSAAVVPGTVYPATTQGIVTPPATASFATFPTGAASTAGFQTVTATFSTFPTATASTGAASFATFPTATASFATFPTATASTGAASFATFPTATASFATFPTATASTGAASFATFPTATASTGAASFATFPTATASTVSTFVTFPTMGK